MLDLETTQERAHIATFRRVALATESALLFLAPGHRREAPLSQIDGVTRLGEQRARLDFTAPVNLTASNAPTSRVMRLWLDADEETASRLEQEIKRLRARSA